MLNLLLSWRALTALSVVSALILTSCSAPAPAASNGGGGVFAGLVGHSRDLGPIAASEPLSVVLLLAEPAGAGIVDVWARRHGMTTSGQPGSSTLIATGSARDVEAAFAVQVHNYRTRSGDTFMAAPIDPMVPAALARLVQGVGRITDFHPPQFNRNVPAEGLKPADVILAYDMKPLRDQGIDGTGETVLIWGSDGHLQADLDAYSTKFGLPPIKVEDRGNPNKKPSPGGEEEMDIEVVHAIAPGARIIVYTPPDFKLASYTALIDKMVTDNPGAIQTHSWGLCEEVWGSTLAQTWLATMQRSVALGETVFVASGDRGGFECPPDDWSQPPTKEWLGLGIPDAIPYVTSVGGTRLSVGTDGTWYDETVWVEHARNTGSTGGVSRWYKAGAWQKAPGTANQYNNGQRMEPDISADSDPVSGMTIRVEKKWAQGGGTSQAAPIWAGITALMNQYLKKNKLKGVGFLNPALYALASGKPQFPPFHDITVGNNMNYPATPGYDLATGLGTPDVWNLTRDLEAYQRNGDKVP